ncbi:hypothetical protein PVK06_045250 [Gossypium arboreum]|uniref:DUF4218 domain-containing protein n=1 Tax=Gossypium arboreum TaxID=29729 RepID=A0ABR0MTJ9_GOSAR|nr:hypothetical protein PVK06_045250 [Gossypium arboreum]
MKIWRDLHPQVLPNGKYRLPPSIFSMSKKEKEVFCMVLKDIKVPDAYASNISRYKGANLFVRFLSKLKYYCRNKRYPEGSIAEGYLAEECMTFCSRYLEDVETRLNKPTRNAGLNDHNLAEIYLFQSYGEPIGKVEIAELDDISWIQAHQYVPFHHDLVEPLHKYSAFLINGYRFHAKYRERMRRTQNYGVVVNSSITSYTSARDSNPVEGNVEYYGLLTDIIELDYYGRWKVVLFRCDWADVNTARGIKKDQFGFTMLNFSHLIHTGQQLMDEPYVFSSQVKQVFYSKDPTDEGWYVVLRNTPRDLFDMGNGSRDDIVERSEKSPFPEQNLDENIPSTNESSGTRRVRERTLLRDLYDLDPVERVKDRERVGTSSSQKQKFTHTAGSRSFASVAEAEEVKSGQKAGRLQLFEITHRKKDGSHMTSETGEIMISFLTL